jgi:hypothetical protein
MIIIGCDFHTRYQQIAMAEESTGELLLERTGGGQQLLKCMAGFGSPTLSGLVYERVGGSSLGFFPKFSLTNLNSVVYYPRAN